jgi:hypothetical protein
LALTLSQLICLSLSPLVRGPQHTSGDDGEHAS